MTDKPKDFTVTQAFSLRFTQVAMVSDLAERWGWKRSAIIQAAVEEFYNNHPEETPNDRNNGLTDQAE